MNTKEQIIQEIEELSEQQLAEVLEFVRFLKAKHTPQGKALHAYLESEEK